jgi:hypothetical protein
MKLVFTSFPQLEGAPASYIECCGGVVVAICWHCQEAAPTEMMRKRRFINQMAGI